MEEIVKGKPYTKKIDPQDADKFATIFGEGSPALTELIKFCILNGIQTVASCKGHPEDRNPIDALLETGYISFKFEYEYDLAYFLASLGTEIKGIDVRIDNNYSIGKVVTIEVPCKTKGQSETFFKTILLNIKKFLADKEKGLKYEPDSFIKKIIDFEFYFPNDTVFEIKGKKFRKFDRVPKSMYLKKVGKCPNYKKSILYRSLSEEEREKKEDEFITSTRRR